MDLSTSAWTAAVASAAVWRVAHLLAAERGPGGVVDALRARARGALDCFYCNSLWCAAPPALWLADVWAERVLWWLALSAAAIGIEELCLRWPAPPMPRFAEDSPAPDAARGDDVWADTQADAFVLRLVDPEPAAPAEARRPAGARAD